MPCETLNLNNHVFVCPQQKVTTILCYRRQKIKTCINNYVTDANITSLTPKHTKTHLCYNNWFIIDFMRRPTYEFEFVHIHVPILFRNTSGYLLMLLCIVNMNIFMLRYKICMEHSFLGMNKI